MLKKILIVLGTTIALVVLISTVYSYFAANKEDCRTFNISIKGKIDYLAGQNRKRIATTTDVQQAFRIDIIDVISSSGFPDEYIDIQVGDSVIKQPESDLITVKRGVGNIAIYELKCIDFKKAESY